MPPLTSPLPPACAATGRPALRTSQKQPPSPPGRRPRPKTRKGKEEP